MTATRELRLRDGATVDVRPIRADDKARLLAAFGDLSPESRYRRFLAPQARLSQRDLHYLTEIDHASHEAIVALDPASGEGVGVARYVAAADDRDTAELAVTVADRWQGRGLGSLLVDALVERARENGVRRFTATVLEENAAMIALLDELGETRLRRRDSGVCEYEVELTPGGRGALAAVLRHVAAMA